MEIDLVLARGAMRVDAVNEDGREAAGAEALVPIGVFAARLKSCPDTNPQGAELG